ncbi:MAG: hypothetical protein JWO26_2784 [Rhodospirillales bacterium]|nr:hypothetical protein [Rhodospirillales bacterium]
MRFFCRRQRYGGGYRNCTCRSGRQQGLNFVLPRFIGFNRERLQAMESFGEELLEFGHIARTYLAVNEGKVPGKAVREVGFSQPCTEDVNSSRRPCRIDLKQRDTKTRSNQNNWKRFSINIAIR